MESSSARQTIFRNILITSGTKTFFRKGFLNPTTQVKVASLKMERLRKLFREGAGERAEEAVIYYRQVITIATWVGVLPYNWNAQTQELEFSKSQTRFVIYVSQSLMYTMYYGFLFYRWNYAAYFDATATTSEKGALQYVAVAYAIAVVLHAYYFLQRDHLHTFINQLLRYVRHDFQRLPDNGMKLRKFGKTMRALLLVAVLVFSLNMLTLFRRPESPHLITSLVPDVTKRKIWELIPFALVQGYLWCNQWAAMSFTVLVIVSHTSVIQNALNRTRPNNQLTPKEFYTATRKFEVLQGNFNVLMRWLLWALQIFVMTVAVFGICGSIWSDGAQAAKLFLVALLAYGILMGLWTGLGGVFEISSEVLAAWRRTHELNVLFRKRMRSMRPVRVQIGGYFYADAPLILTLLSIVSDNTLTILLAA